MNENLIQYNDDETVKVPFGRVAEWYISKHPMLKNIRLKCQSRKKTPGLIKQNIITVGRVDGAVDYIEWKTNKGETKSTNRIDDIIHLTSIGEEYVKEIEAGKKKDKLCWYWVMFCAGDGNNCQRECAGIGSCKDHCANRDLPNNIKNHHDMHLCKVRIISESKLSWLKTSKPLRIKIIGSHLPANALNAHTSNNVSKLNLTREIRDKIILSRRTDYKIAKEIKMKLLAPYNGANEETLKEALNEQREICNDIKLRGFIKRDDRRLKENSESWTILHYLVTEILKLKVIYFITSSQIHQHRKIIQIIIIN